MAPVVINAPQLAFNSIANSATLCNAFKICACKHERRLDQMRSRVNHSTEPTLPQLSLSCSSDLLGSHLGIFADDGIFLVLALFVRRRVFFHRLISLWSRRALRDATRFEISSELPNV